MRGQNRRRKPILLKMTPPRTGERTLRGVERMIESFPKKEAFSLSLVADTSRVTLMIRCRDSQGVKTQVQAHYPQVRIIEVAPEDDPAHLGLGEQAWTVSLWSDGPPYLSLRMPLEDVPLDPGADPLITVAGALSAVRPGERLVSELLLNPLDTDWANRYQTISNHRTEQDAAYKNNSLPLAPVVWVGLAGLGLLCYQAGKLWELAGVSILFVGVMTAWAFWRRKHGNRVHDPQMIADKVSRTSFRAHLQVTVILPEGSPEERAHALLSGVVDAYGQYDHPAGARIKAGRFRAGTPKPSLESANGRRFARDGILSVREVAAMWHLPGAHDEAPRMERGGAKVLPAPSQLLLADGKRGSAGVLVGNTDDLHEVYIPKSVLGRHRLLVAGTGMGKSTLMTHEVVYKLREKALGRDQDAIVVIDPHADLINDLLGLVPEQSIGEVVLIDLADNERAPGINVLDHEIFPDRDRTADMIINTLRHLSADFWGPRMQIILDHAIKSLHEANQRRDRDEQYTLLDVSLLLENADFRRQVLEQVRDPYISRWWRQVFDRWPAQVRYEAVAPVETRLSYYSSSKVARAILGQRRSTIDLRRIIQEGKVLLVSTAQGTVGRAVAGLVGGSLLNLVESVIQQQGSLPADQRRRAMVVVDEFHTIPGVDYESALAELGKFGASYVLATQTLARLQDLSSTLEATVMANCRGLIVFQVAHSDARRLVGELGGVVSEDDLTSQQVHHCYVRLTVGDQRLPAFSMKVLPPELGNPAIAARIRAGMTTYTTLVEDITENEARALTQLRSGAVHPAQRATDGPLTPETGTVGLNQNQRRPHSKRGQSDENLS